MQAIVFTIINAAREIIEHMDAGFCFIARMMVYLWNLHVDVVQWLGVFVIKAIVLAFEVGVELFTSFITICVSLLPSMPDEPGENIVIAGIAQANVYVPVTEMVALSSAWAAVFGVIGAYKLAKFVRGGG